MKNYALYVNDDNEAIEEEVNVEINGVKIKGFSQIYPYRLEKGQIYPVKLTLFLYEKDENDSIDIEIQNENKFGIEQINDSFAYYLYGKLERDILKLGKFDIQDEQLLLFPLFNGSFVRIVARINVEFLK